MVCVLLQDWIGYTVYNTASVCMSSDVYAYPFSYVEPCFIISLHSLTLFSYLNHPWTYKFKQHLMCCFLNEGTHLFSYPVLINPLSRRGVAAKQNLS